MRLVSYNIRGGLGLDGRRSLDRIADVIRGTGADIVCVQEIHRRLPWSGMVDQPAVLAAQLGMRVIFHSTFRPPFGGYGNAILSAMPMRERAAITLPNAGEGRRHPPLRAERRGVLEVAVDTPAGPITIMATHWSLHAGDRFQAAEIVGARVRQAETPVILAGDLNARPASPELLRLQEVSGLLDAGRFHDTPTYPAEQPSARIDYAWHSPEIVVQRFEVVESLASDHRPIVVEW